MIPAPPAVAPLAPGRPPIETIRFPVAGMTCGTCVSRITRGLRRVEGVERIHVDLGGETVTVRRDPGVAADDVIAAALSAAGYQADLAAAQPVDRNDAAGALGNPIVRLIRSLERRLPARFDICSKEPDMATRRTVAANEDPVCGMTVDVGDARAKGLLLDHDDRAFVFCGRGCFLEFRDRPEAFLEPEYRPVM